MISKKEFIEKNAYAISQKQKYPYKLFKVLAQLRLIIPKCNGRIADFTWVTICNNRSLVMVKCSILSFLKNSTDWPRRVIIVSDGSWIPSQGIKLFNTIGSLVNLNCIDWQDCARYHFDKGRLNLYRYATRQIWGKKMAAILCYADQGLTLYSDSDVLWFKSPIEDYFFSKSNLLKISLDNSHNYDENMIGALKFEYLFDRPPVNCGVILIKGDMYLISKKLEEIIQYEAENIGKFSEQTIFAILESEFGETWSDVEIVSSIDDLISPVFRVSNYPPEIIARHYLWALKWLFWRDYLTVI